jgi:hypothetical protein
MPAADDFDDRLSKLEDAVERIERSVIAREGGRDPLDALAQHVEKIVGAFDDMRAQAQEESKQSRFPTVLTDIRDNTAATNILLTAADERLKNIEGELADPADPFPADPAVLAEGRFLKAQLTGLEGTEGAATKFKDAPAPSTPSGFQVLADAVDDLTSDGGVE